MPTVTVEGPPFVWDEERAAHGAYRTRDLILGYYDAHAAALRTWLGPEEKRQPRRHSIGTKP